ncbi:methyl-accepting chemotaxis sensory transducer, partial [Thauera aminoaromatica S2]
ARTTRGQPAPARSTREPRRIGLGNAQPAFASAAADPEYVRF